MHSMQRSNWKRILMLPSLHVYSWYLLNASSFVICPSSSVQSFSTRIRLGFVAHHSDGAFLSLRGDNHLSNRRRYCSVNEDEETLEREDEGDKERKQRKRELADFMWRERSILKNGSKTSSPPFTSTSLLLGLNEAEARSNYDHPNSLKEQISNLYENEDLQNVLNIHKDLIEKSLLSGDENSADITDSTARKGRGSSTAFSLHDIIMQTTAEIDEEIITSKGDDDRDDDDDNATNVKYAQHQENDNVSEVIMKKTRQIRAIACDVDGTLLTSKQTLHPKTRTALHEAIKYVTSASTTEDANGGDETKSRRVLDVFFPATGKSRKGAMNSLDQETKDLFNANSIPGVYLQGLYCVDGVGNVVFERRLSRAAIKAAERLVAMERISIVGYDGDDLYTTNLTPVVKSLGEYYNEPMPKFLPPGSTDGNDFVSVTGKGEATIARSLSDFDRCMHKLLIMDFDTEKLTKIIRPLLEEVAMKYNACVTQALPTMLELLPADTSKARGVKAICESLGIDPSIELLALGDAENDAEMLSMAAIGVAMGNGSPPAKEAADYVMYESNDDGAAGIAMEFFGFRELRYEKR